MHQITATICCVRTLNPAPDRKLILIKSLSSIFTSQQIDVFLNYKLNDKDINFLKTNIKNTLSIIPPDSYNCANLSSLLGAVIMDNSEIPVTIMTGHLDYEGYRLFSCDKPIPTKQTKKNGEYWNGHCWIEFGEYILDLSIFRTVYYTEKFPETIKNNIINKYGKGKGSIMIPTDNFEEYGFTYTPRFALNNNQINGLVLGAEEKYLKNN
jgi:hypothetical protein